MDVGQPQLQDSTPDVIQQPATDFGDQSNTPPYSNITPVEQAEEHTPTMALHKVVGQTPGTPTLVKDEHHFEVPDKKPDVTGHGTPPSAPDPPKLKLTETELLRERLKRDPLDASAHQRLIGLAEASGDVEKIQDAYEGLLEAFPNAVCPTATSQIFSHFFADLSTNCLSKPLSNPGAFQ